MKKRIASVLLALVLAISLIPTVVFAAQTGEITATTSATNVKAGDEFTITVSIGKVTNFAAIQLELKYDSTKLEYIESKANGIFANEDNFFLTDTKGNEISLSGSVLNRPTVENGTTIFTSKFKVKNGATGNVAPILSVSVLQEMDAEYNQSDIATTVNQATVTVPQGVTGVSLDKTTLTLAVNDTGKLTATVTPDNATNKNVTWKSSNTSVATVSADGTVTAKNAGTATITVTTADGGKTATCTVTVVDCKHDGTINHVEAKTATCTATGNIEYWECAKCHTKWSDEGKTNVVINVTTDKVSHQFTKEVKNDKTLKTAGNCMTEAVYYKSCSVCGEVSKTDTFKGEKDANKHTGKNTYNPNNDGTHSVVCECSTVITAKENCSGGTATCIKKAECTKCGAAYGEFAAHKFDTKWTVGKNTHYHACTVAGCTAKADEAAHGIGTKATCQHGNICDGCQRDDGVKASHTAAASHVYVSDANNHWQLCQWCGVEIGKAGHTWNTPATEDDAVYCTTCGYVKTAAKTPCERHTPGNLVADGTYHYTFCKVCGEQLSKDEHTYGEATTVDGKKVEVCKECGYVKTTTVTPPVTPGKPGKPGNTTGEKKVQSQKTFDAGIALYAGMAVLSLTGSAWMIGKKKEH